MKLTFKNWLLYETIVTFGKHKGQDHTSLPTSYLQWAVDNASAMDSALRRDMRAEIARRSSRAPQPVAKPTQQVQQPQQKPAATALPSSAATSRFWVKGKIVGAKYGLKPDQDIALSMKPDRSWEFVTLDASKQTGVIPGNEVSQVVQSVKGPDGQPIKAASPNELMPVVKPSEHSHILPGEKMSEEQKAIDAKFAQVAGGDQQSHIMINALAGTGKTTMLKHLAWKYGNPKQKWLYLVFNTKNKVEAKEKFPQWVEVATTNGFLGEILRLPQNKTKIKQTDRIVDIAKHGGGEGAGKLEKARILADGPKFSQILAQLGLPDKWAADKVMGKEKNTLQSLLTSIRYLFKEQVLTLVGLAKSFAVDPRNQGELDGKLEEIFSKYDFDTSLGDVKDRIEKYGYSYGALIRSTLNKILGYDFMQKDYKQEILQSTKWMLNETMPHASEHIHKRGDIDYKMGHFRDFNDDLWFAAIHANEIFWPHFDFVLADEVQDFNQAQKIVLKKLHEAGAKIVAVGDPNQSIYRFRGADGQAFDGLAQQLGELSQDKEGWKPHTLSKNYRSRPAILDFANQRTHVNNLQAGKTFKDGDPGTVTDKKVKYQDSFNNLKQEKQAGKIKQTAYIARTNEPLVHAALKLLASGVPFIIVGKDIAKDLMKHIDKVMRITRVQDYSPVSELADKLQEHLDGEMEQHGGSSAKKAYMQELGDTTKALHASIEHFSPPEPEDSGFRRQQYGNQQPKEHTVGEFKLWLKANLNGLDVAENERDLKAYREKLEKENPVILTTAHKSKGLEFERVFILRDDQFPHPKAKREEDLAQEANAKYVAYTRAMDQLHILDLKGQPGYKEE